MWALFHLGSREWAVQSTFRSYIATINESEGQDKVMQTCDEPIKIGGGPIGYVHMYQTILTIGNGLRNALGNQSKLYLLLLDQVYSYFQECRHLLENFILHRFMGYCQGGGFIYRSHGEHVDLVPSGVLSLRISTKMLEFETQHSIREKAHTKDNEGNNARG